MIVKLNNVELALYSVNSFTDKETGQAVKYIAYTFRDEFGQTLEANSKEDFTKLEREKVDVELDVDKFAGKWQVKLSAVNRAEAESGDKSPDTSEAQN